MDAGYLKYSAFYLFEKEFRGPTPGEPSESLVAAEMFSYSMGPITGKNPAFSATWEGGMVGKFESYLEPASNLLTGDATVTVGMDGTARDRVSVRFSNITDSGTGAKHSGLSWINLPLRNGAFHYENASVEDTTGTIRGSFYGANHEEVGGVFEGILESEAYRRMTGAFGATRE